MSSSEAQPTTPSRPSVAITEGSRERAKQATDLLAEAFRDDPVIRYMLCSLKEEQRQAYMHDYFANLMKAAGLNGGVFHEAGDWGSCAVWMPPGKKVDNPWTLPRVGLFSMIWKLGFSGFKRMLIEFQPQADAIKKRSFKEHGLPPRYYYLFFIGTHPDHRRKGLSSALLKHFQEQATKENVPLWLESTSENSMRLYAKHGFKEQAKIVLGKGHAGPDGAKEEGGEGVPIWSMMWLPEKIAREVEARKAKSEAGGEGNPEQK